MLKNMNLKQYTDEDYAGDLSILYDKRHCICLALIKTSGNMSKAAKLLNISRDVIFKQVMQHNLYDFIQEIQNEVAGIKPKDTLRDSLIIQFGQDKIPSTPEERYNLLMQKLKPLNYPALCVLMNLF